MNFVITAIMKKQNHQSFSFSSVFPGAQANPIIFQRQIVRFYYILMWHYLRFKVFIGLNQNHVILININDLCFVDDWHCMWRIQSNNQLLFFIFLVGQQNFYIKNYFVDSNYQHRNIIVSYEFFFKYRTNRDLQKFSSIRTSKITLYTTYTHAPLIKFIILDQIN